MGTTTAHKTWAHSVQKETTMIVVISCGGKKQTKPNQAIDMYKGLYFYGMRKWALSVTNQRNIFILSAKHGLMRTTKVIDPYQLKLGEPGSVTVEHVQAQARAMRIQNKIPIVLGSQEYVTFAGKVWEQIETPFTFEPQGVMPRTNAGGHVYQTQYMRRFHGVIPRRQQ